MVFEGVGGDGVGSQFLPTSCGAVGLGDDSAKVAERACFRVEEMKDGQGDSIRAHEDDFREHIGEGNSRE